MIVVVVVVVETLFVILPFCDWNSVAVLKKLTNSFIFSCILFGFVLLCRNKLSLKRKSSHLVYFPYIAQFISSPQGKAIQDGSKGK